MWTAFPKTEIDSTGTFARVAAGSACVSRAMPVRLGLAVSHRNELPKEKWIKKQEVRNL